MQNQENKEDKKNIVLDDLKFIIRRFLIEFAEDFQLRLKDFFKENKLLVDKKDGRTDDGGEWPEQNDIKSILKEEEDEYYAQIKNNLKRENLALAKGQDVREFISKWILELERKEKKNFEKDSDDFWNRDKTQAEELLKLISRYRHKSDTGVEQNYSFTVSEINDTESRYISELIQNADDCEYEDNNNALYIYAYTDALVFRYGEKGFTPRNILAITTIGDSDKANDPTKIGEKGRGFKTVFSNNNKVIIQSRFISFAFEGENVFQLKVESLKEKVEGTRIIAYFKDDFKTEEINELKEMIKSFVSRGGDFFFKPTLFTQKISEIVFKDKENEYVNLEQPEELKENPEENKKAYLIESDLFPDNDAGNVLELLKGRYPSWDETFLSKNDLLEKIKIEMIPCPLDMIKTEKENLTGHVYTFLPTSIDINIPFAFNAPFWLNKNRAYPVIDEMEFKEMEESENIQRKYEWNKHLLDRIFCKGGELERWYLESINNMVNNDIFYYVPDGNFEFRIKSGIREGDLKVRTNEAIELLNKRYDGNSENENEEIMSRIDFYDLPVFEEFGKKSEPRKSWHEAIFFEEQWMYEFYQKLMKKNNKEVEDWFKNIRTSKYGEYILCENPLFEIEEDELKERVKKYIGDDRYSMVKKSVFVEELAQKLESKYEKLEPEDKEKDQKFKKTILDVFKHHNTIFKTIYDVAGDEKKQLALFPYWKMGNGEEILCFESLEKGDDKRWFINETGHEYKNSYDDGEKKYLVLNLSDLDDNTNSEVIKYFDFKEEPLIGKPVEEKLSEEEFEEFIGLEILSKLSKYEMEMKINLKDFVNLSAHFAKIEDIWKYQSREEKEEAESGNQTEKKDVAESENKFEEKYDEYLGELEKIAGIDINKILKFEMKSIIDAIVEIESKEKKCILKKILLSLFLEKLKESKKSKSNDSVSFNIAEFLPEILEEKKLGEQVNEIQNGKAELSVEASKLEVIAKLLIKTNEKEMSFTFPSEIQINKEEVEKSLKQAKKKINIYLTEKLKYPYLFLAGNLLIRKEGEEEDYLLKIKDALASRYLLPGLFAVVGEYQDYFTEKKELDNGRKGNKLTKFEILGKIQRALIFQFLDPNNYKNEKNSSGHSPHYEILQNINDHMAEDTEVTVDWNKEENYISFSYAEKEREIKISKKIEKVQGMQGFDIYALTTLGNSVSQSVKGAIGEKGTGFKSVFDIFKKIEVKSNGFDFILDNTIQLYKKEIAKLDFDSKNKYFTYNGERITEQELGKIVEKLEVEESDQREEEDENKIESIYPILQYDADKQIEKESKNTEFIYFFKEEKREQGKEFFNLENLLFLKIKFDSKADSEIHSLLEGLEDYRKKIKKIPSLLKDEKQEFDSEKNYAQIFFMDLSEEKKDGKFYCGLPIDNVKTEIPVHINLPLLKLEDNRKDIKKDDLTNQDLFSALFDGEEESKYVQVLNVFASEVWASKYNKDNEVQKFYKYIPKFYYRSIDEKWEKDKPQKNHNQFQYCKVFLCYEYDKEKKIWEEKLSNLEDAYILKSKLYEKINSFLKTENRKKDFLKILSDNDINKILLSYGKEDIGDISKIVNVSKIVKVNEVQTTISDVALGYSFIRASYNGDNIVDDNITEIASYIESEKLIPYLYLLSYHRKHKEEDLVKLSFSEDKIIKNIESLVSCIELGKKYAYFSEKIEENIRKKIFDKKQYCDFSSIHEDLEAEVNKNRNNKITLDTLIKELKVKTDEEIFIDKDLFNEVKNSLEVKELGELFRKIVTSKIGIGDEIFGQIPFELSSKDWKTLESLEEPSEGIFLYEKGDEKILENLEKTDERYKENIATKDNKVFFDILSSNIDSEYKSLLEGKKIVILGANKYESDIKSIAEIDTDLAAYLYFDLVCLWYGNSYSLGEEKVKENYFFTKGIEKCNDLFHRGRLNLKVDCSDFNLLKLFNNQEKKERHRKRLLVDDFDRYYTKNEYNKTEYQLKDFFYLSKENDGNENTEEQSDINKIYIYNGKRKEINGRKLNFSYLFLKDNKNKDIILLSDEGQLKKVFQDFGVIYRDLEKISAVPILLNQKSKISLERRITPDVCNNEKLVYKYKNENAKSFEKETIKKETIKLRWMADYYYQEKIYPGYGQFCPICNSRIITQLSGVRLPWIVVTLEEKEDNFKIQLCSCMNCKEAIDKSIDVQILKICSGSNGSNYEKFKDKYDFGAYLLKMNTKLALTMDLLLKTGDTITETFEWHPNFIHRIDMYNASMKEKRGKDGQ